MYSPFPKPIGGLQWPDLQALISNGTAEGLYVDYKRDWPSNQDVGKEIAAFANTEGGYLIIGAEEVPGTNTVKGFPGFSLADRKKPQEDLRNIVNGHVNPAPKFESVLVPDSKGNGVLVAFVPPSNDAPHVTSDGRIYRRLAAGSDPIEKVKHPAEIDKMRARGERWRSRINDFCQLPFGLTKGNEAQCAVELYCIPDTLGEPVCIDLVRNPEAFRDIVTQSRFRLKLGDKLDELLKEEPTAGFNCKVRATAGGLVAQVFPDGVDSPTAHTPMTMAFYADGSMAAYLPVPTLTAGQVEDGPCADLVSQTGDVNFIDATKTLLLFLVVMNHYANALEWGKWEQHQQGRIAIRMRIRGIYRACLLSNEKWFRSMADKLGLPICYEDEVEVPRFDDLALPANTDLMHLAQVANPLLGALGLTVPFREECIKDAITHVLTTPPKKPGAA